jgi:glycosyltransferase involved in cell wall biosynthesis
MTTRILIVAGAYPSYDAPYRGIFVADLARLLVAAGLDVRVLSWEPAFVLGEPGGRARLEATARAGWLPLLEEALAENELFAAPRRWGAPGVPVARLPVLDDPLQRSWSEAVRRRAAFLEPVVRALWRRWPFHLVHAQAGAPDALAVLEVADELGVPLLASEHASDAPSRLSGDRSLAAAYRRLLDPGARPPRRLVAVSPALAGRLEEVLADDLSQEAGGRRGGPPGEPRGGPEGRGEPEGRPRIGILPNVVAVEDFPLAPLAARDPHELLWVGGRSEKKGTDRLLEAFHLLRQRHPELRLRLVGSAPSEAEEERWRELAHRLGVADATSFEPPTDRAGVARAMARAAVFVHPSPWETFGLVAAEALATGLPVAATPSGGVEAIVGHDGSCGEIATGLDPADLARAVERVLDRRRGLDPMTMRRRVEERFGPAAVQRVVLDLYGELLGRPVAGGDGADEATRGARPRDRVPGGPPERALVVGFHRVALQRRLASLPASFAAAVAALAGPLPPDPRLPNLPPLAALEEVDPDEPYRRALAEAAGPSLTWLPAALRRLLRVVLAPRAAMTRRWLLSRRSELRRSAMERAVARSVGRLAEAAGAAARGPLWVVPLDAEDRLIVTEVVGPAPAPSGPRPLSADRAPAPSGDRPVSADRRSVRAATGQKGERVPHPDLAMPVRIAPGGLRWLADRWSQIAPGWGHEDGEGVAPGVDVQFED